MISEGRADELSDMPKVIDSTWRWQYKSEKDKYEGEVPVLCRNEQTTLRLVGWINKRLSYSFSILHKGSIPIRRWGDHIGHTNPKGAEIDGPHKHKWREDVGTGYAYKTDDVSRDSVDDAFFDFLNEEAIEFNGQYYQFEESRLDDWV